MNKTHYRKVFKSDHLGVADLEDFIEAGKGLVFTIAHVKQEFNVTVAGRKGNYNIAYFKEDIKPLVVNAGNSKVLKKMTGSVFVEDWLNIPVQLYIDPNAKLAGEIVGGVRIHPDPPKTQKPEVTPQSKAWPNAIAAYKRDGDLKKVLEHATVSKENQELIIEIAEKELQDDAA